MSERQIRNVCLAVVAAIALLTMGRWAGLEHEGLSAAVTLGLGALLIALAFRGGASGAQSRSGRSG
jgi:hypothetical protein